ncbi:MAG: hypothetical protein R3Y29_03345 [bacterium]
MLLDNLSGLESNAKKILNTNLSCLYKNDLILLESSCTINISSLMSELRSIKSENYNGEYDSVLDEIREIVQMLKVYREEIKSYRLVAYIPKPSEKTKAIRTNNYLSSQSHRHNIDPQSLLLNLEKSPTTLDVMTGEELYEISFNDPNFSKVHEEYDLSFLALYDLDGSPEFYQMFLKDIGVENEDFIKNIDLYNLTKKDQASISDFIKSNTELLVQNNIQNEFCKTALYILQKILRPSENPFPVVSNRRKLVKYNNYVIIPQTESKKVFLVNVDSKSKRKPLKNKDEDYIIDTLYSEAMHGFPYGRTCYDEATKNKFIITKLNKETIFLPYKANLDNHTNINYYILKAN